MPHPVTIGKRTRMSFSKIKEIADVPNLIELQVDSYKWFIEEGLKEVFEDISPIEDYTGNLILEFVDYSLDDKPKYDIEECKDRDATYCAPLKVKVRLINKETGEIKEQEVFMGDFPLMTEKGTFVINGAERVIVSQLVRSPGVYYALERDKTGKKLISSTVIPNRGAWLEYETDSNDVISVRVDRTRKQPVTVLLRALGIGTDAEIIELLGEDERLAATLEKDNTKTVEEGLIEIYKKLRPGEPPTVESASSLLNALFFDAKRYDLAKVGRYKFNKKLALCYRIMNKISAEDVVNPETGEVFVKAGEKISYEVAKNIQNAGINVVTLLVEDEKVVKVIGNNFVDIKSHVDFDIDELDIKEKVHYPTLKEILEAYSDEEEIKEAYEAVDPALIDVIRKALVNIRSYHEKQRQNSWFTSETNGTMLGQKVTALERVGVYVPGGKAVYPSSVLMNIVPAKVAGVDQIVMTTPPGKDGKVNPSTLVAAKEAGADEIYKVGGAQAIGALAYGTESIPKVDKIVGPGNIFVALAKKAVYGYVSIDSIAGPSEILVLADETANPRYVAADLLSQAEHDELASAILITTSKEFAAKVSEEVDGFVKVLSRKEIIQKSLDNFGYILIAEDMDEAIEAANAIASEHMEIVTANPFEVMMKVRNAGAIFIGENSSEPLGDYFAGPNHVLPTNGTAKFFSALSVDDFVKKSSIVYYSREALRKIHKDIEQFATSEQLTAHANSIAVRFEDEEQ